MVLDDVLVIELGRQHHGDAGSLRRAEPSRAGHNVGQRVVTDDPTRDFCADGRRVGPPVFGEQIRHPVWPKHGCW